MTKNGGDVSGCLSCLAILIFAFAFMAAIGLIGVFDTPLAAAFVIFLLLWLGGLSAIGWFKNWGKKL